MRKAITALLGSSILFTSGAALAQYQTGGQYQTGTGGTYQPMYSRPRTVDNIGGSDAQFVFGVERITGVFANSLEVEDDPGNVTTLRWTDIALFGNGAVNNVHAMPRLGLDYFVIEGLSLGGSLVYWRRSGEAETEPAAGGGATTDQPTASQFLINPRVGYSFVFDETFAIWPKAGITYGNSSLESTDTSATGATVDTKVSLSTLALSLDVPVVISPIENFAILIGPFIDFGVSGSVSTEVDPAPPADIPDSDAKLTSFGLSMGIAGYY